MSRKPGGEAMPASDIHPVPPLAGLALALLTLQLGNWQLGRADEKTALQARIELAAAAAPLPDGATDDAPDWRTVTLRGEWLSEATIYLDNRVRSGRVGYELLTPLRLDGGGWVLVDRGWIAAGRERSALPHAPPPSARAELTGTVRRPESKPFALAADAVQGRVWQFIDVAQYRERTGIAVRDWIVQQTSAAPDGLVRDWPRPDAGIDRHRGYAVQWYALAALSLALTLAYLFRRVAR